MTSILGLGTWAMGGPYEFGWGPSNDDQSIEVIKAAATQGITWIDTAPAYGLGHAEKVVGLALKELPKDVLFDVFTKCGRLWDPGDPKHVYTDLRPDGLAAQVEASFKRLGVSRVTCIQIHRPDPKAESSLEASWEALARLAEQGYADKIGLCNVSLSEYQRCESVRHVDTVQLGINLVRGPNRALIDACLSNGTAVLGYSPLASGLLSGSYNPDRLAADDWRANSKFHTGAAFQSSQEVVTVIREIADRYNCSVPEIAISWVLRAGRATGCIVGARTKLQLESWIDATSVTLSREDLLRLNNAAME